MLFLGPVPRVRERSRVRPGKEEKALPIPQTPPPRRARDHRAVCVSLPLLLRCRDRRLVGPGPSRPPSVRKSAFSSDPMKRGRAWGRPGTPRPPDARSFGRVPLAASRLWGGKTRAFVSPAAARASSLRVRGGTTRGKRACRRFGWRAVSEPGTCYPWRGKKGARARTPECRGTPIPPLPRGCVRASVGARSRAGRAGLGGGGLPGPTRPPSVPAASGPSRASPSLPFPRTAASSRASRACVARVVCRVEVASLPLPGSVPTVGEQRLTRPSSGSGIRFWLCGVVTSLSGAAFGENGGRSSPGASPDASGPVAAGGPSFGVGGRVCLGGGSVREGARGRLCAFREPREGKGGLADVRRLRRGGGSAGRGASGDSSGPVVVVLREGASRVGNRHRTGLGAWR